MTALDTFQKFIDDEEASTCYITGMAGTGKTTSLAELIEWCMANSVNTVTCAFTHQAVKVLTSKVPYGANNILCTLHSYLKKRPGVNGEATKLAHMDVNTQVALPDHIDVLFVDEFSMIGDRDYESINTLQYGEEGKLVTKVIYIGDVNQLPPVKDEFSIIPKEPYWIQLTQIHRQANDNPLINTLIDLNAYINGERVCKLEPHDKFIRGVDIVDLYKQCTKTKILLAYTNAQVEYLNSIVQGRAEPIIGDILFCPTIRKSFTLQNISKTTMEITNIKGEVVDHTDIYRTLDTLRAIDKVEFFTVASDEGEESTRAVVFGHDSYLKIKQNLAKIAVKTNRDIENKFNTKPSWWANSNWAHPLAKARKEAWKNYLAFNSNVVCMDFNHAMTIHKCQGSTYEQVFIDMKDVGKCADKDYKMYLKLLYVAISRASDIVYTN